VNLQSTNKMTLHTDPGCSINGKDCQGSQGCSVDSGPYADTINSAGGATYALEWTSEGMNIWGWSGGRAPSDATGNNPDPSGWGSPTGSFPSGVWAGEVWASDPQCSSLAPTCQEYVQNNPQAFADAYWTINSLKVYTNGGGSSSTGGSTTGSTGTTGTTGTTEEQQQPPPPPPPQPARSRTAGGSGVRVAPTTVVPPAGDPTATTPAGGGGRFGGGGRGGGRGGGGGGRGGRGGKMAKRKFMVRGRHMKHLIIETSARDDEKGQSVILEAGVPELGEELKI
ncbi:MAG: hypothetical protein Q9224_007131, partial [Gallowayella concinna]